MANQSVMSLLGFSGLRSGIAACDENVVGDRPVLAAFANAAPAIPNLNFRVGVFVAFSLWL